VIVYHIAVTPVADYVARREPHRRAHIERLQGLRAAGILLGGADGWVSPELLRVVASPSRG